ncbi:acyltransferase [Sinomonas sp. RB5]
MRSMLTALKTVRRRQRTLGQNVHVGEGFTFGNHSRLWAPRSLTIGSECSIGSYVRIEVDGVIGDSVLIANSAAIVGRHDHEVSVVGTPIKETRWVGSSPDRLSMPVLIGSDVWIGFGSTILSGVEIGDGAVIGAGAVVSRSIPANSIAVGNPARVVGKRFEDEACAQHWHMLRERGVRRMTDRTSDQGNSQQNA